MTALTLTFGCAISAFLASTIYVQVTARSIDASAFEIADDAAPGVVHLATVRAEASRLEALLADPRGASPDLQREVPELVRGLETAIVAYYALPICDEERAVLDRDRALALVAEIARASTAVLDALARGDHDDARRALDHDLRPASLGLTLAATELIRFDARRAHDLALEIHTLRRRSMTTAFALDAAIAILSAIAAIVAVRIGRQHTRVVEAHARLVEARAAELEQFAGRVAHDIISPLQATRMALHIARSRGADPEARLALDRGDAGVARVARVVEGLLGFARAAATPAADVRAEVRPVVDEILGELRPRAEEGGIRLSADAPPGLVVACDATILSVVIGNLVQNAIKYMGSGATRRIAVRAETRAQTVRIEVEDTGPGLPHDLGDRAFEPYVRGDGRGESGIGLGLATVKRIIEAHRGQVGVRSSPGEGCLFWIELPHVDRARECDDRGPLRA